MDPLTVQQEAVETSGQRATTVMGGGDTDVDRIIKTTREGGGWKQLFGLPGHNETRASRTPLRGREWE